MSDFDHLPAVMYEPDIAEVIGSKNRNTRTVQRLKRAGALPEPLPIPGRPRWSKDSIIAWLSTGSSSRGRRRHGR